MAWSKRKSVENAHKFAFFVDKKGNNLIMHISRIMIFGGILEGVWPFNNQKKFDCVTSDARVKVEKLDFLNTSITVYTSHLNGGRRVMSDSPLYNITCV